mmetsp:Transcript_103220/g.166418  ORF Transcript_103220/g.166418 Transcript_103220/m.166418 type:complete len:242 (+) Transcript_103220:1761-2486(+)
MRVATGGLDFENAVLDGEERHVKCASPEIENEHVLALFFRLFHFLRGVFGSVRRCDVVVKLLVEPIRKRRCCRLVYNPHHLEASNGASVFGGIALRVVEVRGYRDHCALDVLLEGCFSSLLHLNQHHRRNFLGRKRPLFPPELNFDDRRLTVRAGRNCEGEVLGVVRDNRVLNTPSYQSLCVEYRVRRIASSLRLSRLTNKALALGEGYDGRRGPRSLCVCKNLGALFCIKPDSNTRISGA